jgi:hypothetical protein
MSLELIMTVCVAGFLSIVALGHVLLLSVMLKIWREDFGGGKQQPGSPASAAGRSTLQPAAR